jgi:hypothetical protein
MTVVPDVSVLSVNETEIVAVFELTDPPLFDTRTQYLVVLVSDGVVYELDVAPPIGLPVFPLVPTYHW